MSGTVRVSRVKDEAMGNVYYITIQDLPDELSPIRFYLWRCARCGAEVHAWTLRQLSAVVQSHMKKHAGWEA